MTYLISVILGLTTFGIIAFQLIKYMTTPSFSDNNFKIKEDLCDPNKLKFVGKHSSQIKMTDIPLCVAEMKQVFRSNLTRKLSNRRVQLQNLVDLLTKNKDKIAEALQKDLGRDQFIAVAFDVSAAKNEIKYLLKNLDSLNAPHRVGMAIATFPAIDYEVYEPFGTIFINGIWNFPFGTLFGPIGGALAAGNNVVIKPCQTALETSKLICDLLNEYMDSRFVQVIGHNTVGTDYEITDKILENEFDFIFFTGSSNGGKYIMQKASKYLTPLLLELGGKNPTIVDETADIDRAVKQILIARTTNCGQMCISPDYVLCDEKKMDEFVEKAKKQINQWFFPKNDKYNNEYVGKIVNKRQFDRVVTMLKNTNGKIICGGNYDEKTLVIEPTVIVVDDYNDNGMKQETFGPVLWIKSIKNIYEAVDYINSKPKPLSLYMFSENKTNQNYVVNNTSSGGMQINGAAGYVANSNLGFGGVGSSGMGTYHGKKTFTTFCHTKPVVKSLREQSILYPPRDGWKLKLLRYI